MNFRTIPGLRTRTDEDGTTIAVTAKKRLRRDHLYQHGPDTFGLYWEAATPRGAPWKRSYWLGELGDKLVREYQGDTNGILVFRADPSRADLGVPGDFLKTRRGYARRRKLRNV
jgi:hypothetical protein